jgi:asparagine synthase (glutamine-hydrolysing)
MCEVMRNRGPDDEGYYNDSNISLGNKRLAIIDLNSGSQPIFNEDQSIVIVYNGMIYNFRELRRILEDLGHRFYTSTDTEVVVHSYEEWGVECLKKFKGMFAFALWDTNNKRLFLARDLCGINPLYYIRLKSGAIIFASEIKALLQCETVERNVDIEGFHYFINLRFLPCEKTLFQGIKRLLPGHFLIFDKDGFRSGKFWDELPKPQEYREDYVEKMLETLLKNSVNQHLISDVPVGVYLSGGMDSSTIVAIASKAVDLPIQTFTMGFGENNDEMDDARFVANYFNTEHRELIIDSTLLKEYPNMIWYADLPKRNLYPYYIAKEVSKYVKVVLSGLGGDEIFAGYDWKYSFAADMEEERKRIPPRLLKDMQNNASQLIKHLSNYGALHDIEHIYHLKRIANHSSNLDLYLMVMSLDEVFEKDYLNKIYGKKVLEESLPPVKGIFQSYFANQLSFIDQILFTDFKVKMVDDFLHVDDSMSMANSLEGRYPFLDRDLIEFSLKVPYEYKFQRSEGKYVLKKVMRKILPLRVLEKLKQGFGGNVGLQFSQEVSEYAKQMLPEGYSVKKGFVKKEYIENVLNRKISMNLVKHYTVIWNLLAFEVWYRIFILPDKVRKPNKNLESMI